MRRTRLLIVGLGLVAPSLLAGEPRFTEMAGELGLDFVHFNGMSEELYFVEMMGQGLAVLDFDNDGDLDVYCLQGHMLGEDKPIDDASLPTSYSQPLTDRLYRNDLALASDGSLRPHFVDVTERSGISALGYGMGVATGDFDNDGWVDLYISNWGPNQLLRNNGDGTFTDVTAEAGVDDDRYSASTVFFDYDRDGWLDLFVTNYVDWRYELRKDCFTSGGARDYCAPWVFEPAKDRLFHNRGDGTFEVVTQSAGIAAELGAGLGVVTADFDADGWIDFYVANDALPNHLWMNQRDGTFINDALLAGCAVNDLGMPEGSMGLVAGDLDGDGSVDLFMSHIVEETNTLYLNDGTGMFREAARDSGLGLPSFKYTGFGTALFDFDNDGWLDIFVANGAVHEIEELIRKGEPFPIHQPDQLYRNRGNAKFADVTLQAGAFVFSEVGRGVSHGDLDNDGDPELLVANNAGPVRLFLNESGQEASWLGVRLVSASPPRDLSDTRVDTHRDDRITLRRWSGTDGSYASASDPRVLLGLGEGKRVEKLEVTWPDGSRQRWVDPPIGRYLTVQHPGGD